MTLILVFSFTIIIKVEKITWEEENYSNDAHKDRHLWMTLEKKIIIIIREMTSGKSENTPQLSTDKSFSAETLHVRTHTNTYIYEYIYYHPTYVHCIQNDVFTVHIRIRNFHLKALVLKLETK